MIFKFGTDGVVTSLWFLTPVGKTSDVLLGCHIVVYPRAAMLPFAPPKTNPLSNTPLSEKAHQYRLAKNRLISRFIFSVLTLGAAIAPIVLGFLIALEYEKAEMRESSAATDCSVVDQPVSSKTKILTPLY